MANFKGKERRVQEPAAGSATSKTQEKERSFARLGGLRMTALIELAPSHQEI
jgi:hypothetical protein